MRNISVPEISFSLFFLRFGGATGKWTSKSCSSCFFALDTPIMGSVRPKMVENRDVEHKNRTFYCVKASEHQSIRASEHQGIRASEHQISDYI